MPGGTQLDSARFVVGFRSEPQTISVGRHFTVEVAVCPKPGMPGPENLVVDARMPEHRHGMNYKAQVTSGSAGHYRASGLMFHMPGRWEFVFDIGAERLTHSVRVE